MASAELGRRFSGSGVRLRTGPVVFCVRSEMEALQIGVRKLYHEHEVVDSGGFVDFDVSIESPRSVRRWLRPQAHFRLDGRLPFNPLPADQAFPMMEWGLNWCISSHLHRYLMIHSAVVARGAGAILLPAPPGSGKSTLCAALNHSGWRVLSDELAIIDPLDLNLVPVPRPVSLKNASIDVIRQFAPEAVFGPVIHDTSKGTVAHVRPTVESILRQDEKSPARWIVFPKFEKGATTRLETLSRARALVRLVDNSFNFPVYGRKGFELLAEMVRKCDCYELTFGSLEEALPLLNALLEENGACSTADGP